MCEGDLEGQERNLEWSNVCPSSPAVFFAKVLFIQQHPGIRANFVKWGEVSQRCWKAYVVCMFLVGNFLGQASFLENGWDNELQF